MYEDYFALKRPPFSMTPDPRMLYVTARHREALAGLTYATLSRRGFVVLTGQAGTGKTTLLRKLLKAIPSTRAHLSVIFNPTVTANELLELALMNFGVIDVPASKPQRLRLLEQRLIQAHEQNLLSVLIIDEAHKLHPEVLEEVRLLSNFETDDHKLLQIVLAGHPELDDVLNSPELWQFKQRIAVRAETGPLSLSEVHEYLKYRWMMAESPQPLPFTSEAISLIALWSRGIPRLINSICDNALLSIVAAGATMAGPANILEVVRDLDIRAAKEAAVVEQQQASTATNVPETSVVEASTAFAAGEGSPAQKAEWPESFNQPIFQFERYNRQPSKQSFIARWASSFVRK